MVNSSGTWCYVYAWTPSCSPRLAAAAGSSCCLPSSGAGSVSSATWSVSRLVSATSISISKSTASSLTPACAVAVLIRCWLSSIANFSTITSCLVRARLFGFPPPRSSRLSRCSWSVLSSPSSCPTQFASPFTLSCFALWCTAHGSYAIFSHSPIIFTTVSCTTPLALIAAIWALLLFIRTRHRFSLFSKPSSALS